jgi:HSP90 family molecular chaperone
VAPAGDHQEILKPHRISNLSSHDKSEWNAEKKESIKTRTTEQINAASAMWQRPKSELKDDDYKEFYKSITGDWEDPLVWFIDRAMARRIRVRARLSRPAAGYRKRPRS